ncbi:MAG: type II toxin-antitoxin system VapC family toxin [Chloroflexi bacterium]|nr:type II toxin-antitoxin system VapC family toxin [Chloroflexota bacterium]
MPARVIDASVVTRSVFPSQSLPEARQVLDDEAFELFAPELILHEVANAGHRLARRLVASVGDIEQFLSDAADLRIILIDSRGLWRRAFALASLHKLPAVYDAVYLAAAEALECELWTCDARFARTVRQRGHALVRLCPDDIVATNG